METRNESTRNRAIERETLAEKQTRLLARAAARAAARHRAMIGAWVGITAVALVATVALLESCGQDGGGTKAASNPHQTTAAPQQNVIASSDGEQVAGGGTVLQQPFESSEELKSVPPDAVVSASDTFVTAGQPIEVRVEATADVTEMALSDGLGDALPMVRDSSSNIWRVNYRVPLRPRADRLGLAVMAKNDSNRWRRVWLFLQIDNGKQQVETQTPVEAGVER